MEKSEIQISRSTQRSTIEDDGKESGFERRTLLKSATGALVGGTIAHATPTVTWAAAMGAISPIVPPFDVPVVISDSGTVEGDAQSTYQFDGDFTLHFDASSEIPPPLDPYDPDPPLTVTGFLLEGDDLGEISILQTASRAVKGSHSSPRVSPRGIEFHVTIHVTGTLTLGKFGPCDNVQIEIDATITLSDQEHTLQSAVGEIIITGDYYFLGLKKEIIIRIPFEYP